MSLWFWFRLRDGLLWGWQWCLGRRPSRGHPFWISASILLCCGRLELKGGLWCRGGGGGYSYKGGCDVGALIARATVILRWAVMKKGTVMQRWAVMRRETEDTVALWFNGGLGCEGSFTPEHSVENPKEMYGYINYKYTCSLLCCSMGVMLQLPYFGSKPESWAIMWSLSSQSVQSREQWLLVTSLCFAPSRAPWSTGEGTGAAASAVNHTIRAGASCQSGSCVYPDNMVGMLSEPGAALCQRTMGYSPLLADSG